MPPKKKGVFHGRGPRRKFTRNARTGAEQKNSSTRRVYDVAVNENLFSEQPNCKTESDQHNNQSFREANDILPPSLTVILILTLLISIISAGFDVHRKETMNFGYVGMIEEDYEWLTKQLVKVAYSCCSGRIVSVLER